MYKRTTKYHANGAFVLDIFTFQTSYVYIHPWHHLAKLFITFLMIMLQMFWHYLFSTHLSQES